MPPAPKVSHDDAIKVLLKNGEELSNFYSKENKLPPHSSDFYKKISEQLDGKWTAQDVYRNLREDRKSLRTDVLNQLGLNQPQPVISVNVSQDEFDEAESSSDEENDSDFENDVFSKEDSTFHLIIEEKLYDEMKPVYKIYKNRQTLVLPPRVWTDIVADQFWRQHRLPCAFSFKKATVSTDPCAKNFIKIMGTCKSKLCNAKFHAYAEEEPVPGGCLILKVRTRDTSQCHHEPMQRQLRNNKRQIIGEQVLAKGASNVVRELTLKEGRRGEINRPIVYNLPVLRKLKQETRDKELGVTTTDGKNPIETLKKLKRTPPYAGSIGVIAADPPFMHYILPDQILVLKQYANKFKNTWHIIVDSTGGLVESISIDNNHKSGHIFLYEIIINTDGLAVPVGQMLSSAQDTATIEFFFKKWLKAGASVPKETVCDYGRAILNALSLSFNLCPLSIYIQKCFFALRNKISIRPANTFLRIDVAHFIAIIYRAKCFRKDMPAVKDFYLRVVALMVSCNDFNKFEEILKLVLIVSLHDYDGNIYGRNESTPAQNARLKLQKYIETEEHNITNILPDEEREDCKTIFRKIELKEEGDIMKEDDDDDTMREYDYFLNQHSKGENEINKWIKELQNNAEMDMKIKGTFVNGYRNIGFHKGLLKLAKEFPLWTAVMTSLFQSKIVRASSAAVEGDFNDLKNRILWNTQSKLQIHKFFIIHYRALCAMSMIAASKLLNKCTKEQSERQKSNLKPDHSPSKIVELIDENEKKYENVFNHDNDLENEEISELTLSHSELQYVENWRNKAEKENSILNAVLTDTTPTIEINDKIENTQQIIVEKNNDLQADSKVKELTKKRNKNKYFHPYPEINHVNPAALKKTKKLPKLHLQNGCLFKNLVNIGGQLIRITNTCPFDSIVQILVTAVIDCEEYMLHIKASTNDTCKFLLDFAESGAKANVYLKRTQILSNFNNGNDDNNANSTTIFRTVNAYSSITQMWMHIMICEPSIRLNIQCPQGCSNNWDIPFLSLNSKTIQERGFQSIESAIHWPVKSAQTCFDHNCPAEVHNVYTNSHIFIDLDIPSGDENDPFATMKCNPRKLPVFINLQNEQFRLAGIVVHSPGHFVALCRRSTGKWELHNDIDTSSDNYVFKELITPSAAIYIKIKTF